MLILKIHQRNERVIVSVCDEDILGKKFEEDEKQLDLTGSFYQGEPKTATEVGDIIRNANIVHLTGKEAVALGLEEGVIQKENILTVQDIPHAQGLLND